MIVWLERLAHRLPLSDALRRASRDELAKRLLRNVTYLLTSNTVVGLLGLVTLSLVARALGPAALGVLAMIEAYAGVMERCIRLEPWQAVIKYGADALTQDRSASFRRLIKFSSLVDLGGASLAAIVAMLGAHAVGPIVGVEEDVIEMTSVFCLAIAFHLVATPTAVLRLFDRFGLFAGIQTALAAIRLLLVAVAFAAGAGLWTFLLVFIFCQLLESAALLAIAWRELRIRGYTGVLKTPLAGILTECQGIWGFIWSSNISLMFRQSTLRLDTLIVGGAIDPTAAGLYHVAKRFGNAVLRFGRPVQQAVYPDLARLWTRGKVARFRKITLAINLATGTVGMLVLLVLALKIEVFVSLTVGPAFLGASVLIIVQMLAVNLFMFGIALRPAMWSLQRHAQDAKITVVATIVFFTWLIASLPLLGVIGANLAHLLFNAIWLSAALWTVLATIRTMGDQARGQPPDRTAEARVERSPSLGGMG